MQPAPRHRSPTRVPRGGPNGGPAVRRCDERNRGRRTSATFPRGEESAVPVMPGAEPFTHVGGSTGALLCHGFTGSPQSLRPWAEYLANAGLSVWLARLPGDGPTCA